MNFENVNLFDLASRRLEWASHRQRTIAENIANSDVAGYRAKQVESFDSYMAKVDESTFRLAPEVKEANAAWGSDLSGNSVVVEEQLLEASSANGQFRMATNLYRKAYEMVATVVTGR